MINGKVVAAAAKGRVEAAGDRPERAIEGGGDASRRHLRRPARRSRLRGRKRGGECEEEEEGDGGRIHAGTGEGDRGAENIRGGRWCDGDVPT